MPTATDGFNRTNETPLAAPWTSAGENNFNLAGNVAVPDQNGQDCSMIYTGTFGNDQSSSAKLNIVGGSGAGAGIGLYTRHPTTATKSGYRLCGDHVASNNWELARFVAGAFTSLLVFTRAWTNGDLFELRAVGPASATVLTVYHNGVQIQQTTDNSTIASGNPGLGYSGPDGGTSAWSADDWTGTDTFGVVSYLGPRRMPLGV